MVGLGNESFARNKRYPSILEYVRLNLVSEGSKAGAPMEEKIEKLCADLINACATIRQTLPDPLSERTEEAQSVVTELAARGISRREWQELVAMARVIEACFYEEPKPQ